MCRKYENRIFALDFLESREGKKSLSRDPCVKCSKHEIRKTKNVLRHRQVDRSTGMDRAKIEKYFSARQKSKNTPPLEYSFPFYKIDILYRFLIIWYQKPKRETNLESSFSFNVWDGKLYKYPKSVLRSII